MRSDGKSLVAAPPDGRALWLRHDGSSINLMASTYFIPAGLVLPVDDCFEVRILRIDPVTKCLYVRPLCIDNQYGELSAAVADYTKDSCRLVVSEPLSMSTVYMIRTKRGYLRAVLLKREKTMTYSMYGIDIGEVYNISANDICELLPSLHHVPPLCLRIILESRCNAKKCEEFAFLKEGAICIIKICNEFPSDYPKRAKEMYPPAIVSQIYEKNEDGKYVEVTCAMKSININGGISSSMPRRRCRALVVKSASIPAITRGPALPFMFQKFNVSLPARLIARVTERLDYDTYLMRNPEILDDLTKRMVMARTPLTSRLCLDRGICCIARLIRPARSNGSSFQPQIFRAIASHYRPDDNTCEVLLVDFGQTIVCTMSDLFELQDQPVEVLEKPTASFRCRVKRFSPSKKNGNKGIRLLDENDYNVCLTLKCARDLYWAKVTLLDTDFVLYYKKLRVNKEANAEKNMNEGMSIDIAPQDAIRKLEQRKEELHEEEERLYEQEELLKKEKENFANESIKREQELQLIALQMQLCDISAKLDMVTSNNSSFLKADGFCPQQDKSNYCDAPITKGYSQHGNGYDSNDATSIPQQQQKVAVNQSWRPQWPCSLPAPHTSGVVTSTKNSMRSSMPYMPDAQVSFSNAKNDCYFGIPKCNRNINDHDTPEKWHFHPKKRRAASPKTARAFLFNDTSSNSNNGYSPHNNKLQPLLRLNSKNKKHYKVSVSADSFWDSCHRKLEYGEPPHRTISDYCNTARKQSHGSFPERSLSAVLQYTNNVSNFSNRRSTQLKLEQSRKAVGDTVASDASHTSLIKKPIYASNESADYSQLCISTSNYGEQEIFALSQPQTSLHQNNELQSFPTYQVYHKLVSIIDGSELMVRRVGSDADWPVFFVVPTTALQDISAECFGSLYPTQKLNANGIAIGVLCVVECNDLRRTKVRAVIERITENLVCARHIDDGHMETIPRNQLWSTEDLSPNVRTQPALAVPCILASLNEAQLVKTINYHVNKIPCVGQLMRILFKEQRNSDGIWIVELINGMNNDGGTE
ncbi:unnamed protein product [Cercopithifilaria johnstoni]|uniref:Tudor domain-containing protein n=1 Tax=Cercopithifilaria johnstoni TaxID=2874296 RepID=A0A8J2M1A5_9BILA|nr:unnamed protein product [Cercopithifilaria johnstoni]